MPSTTATENVPSPIHPGEILLEEFLADYDMSQYELARSINVPAPRINAIVLGKRGISADTALRLGRFFGNSARFWLNLQNQYDLNVAAATMGDLLEQIEPLANSRVELDPRQ